MKHALLDLLIPTLREHFPALPFQTSTPAGNVIVVPAKHPDVGNIEIHDDGDELTLYLGKFTHLHIGNYDDQLNEEQKAREIVKSTVAFLSDVFDDEVVFWGSHRDGGGTYRLGHEPNEAFPHHGPQYVWSGPLK